MTNSKESWPRMIIQHNKETSVVEFLYEEHPLGGLQFVAELSDEFINEGRRVDVLEYTAKAVEPGIRAMIGAATRPNRKGQQYEQG